MRAKVIDNPKFERDLHTGALINIDKTAQQHAIRRRMRQKRMQEERVAFQNELSELKETCKSLQSQIDDLKKLL